MSPSLRGTKQSPRHCEERSNLFSSLRRTKQSSLLVILSSVEGYVRGPILGSVWVPNVDASTSLSMTCGKIASSYLLAMTRHVYNLTSIIYHLK